MDKQDKETIATLKEEIGKFADKSFKVMFFVPSTGGIADDNIGNVYKLALATKNNGYDVVMLYSEKPEDFAGVEEWMGEEYGELEHVCVNDIHDSITVSPSDTLIIPDFLFPVMMKAAQSQLPCQKILIAQDIRYVFDSLPLGQQLATYGIENVIAMSEGAAADIRNYFPAVNVDVVRPGLNEIYYDNGKIREPYIMIMTEDEDVINHIAKGFYLKYPIFKFVSFKDSSHLSEAILADALRETSLVIFDNTNDNNGENILRALRCGCTVLARVPNHFYDWMAIGEDGLTEAVYWYPETSKCVDMIAAIVENVIEGADVSPEKEDVDKVLAPNINVDYNKIVGDVMEKYMGRHEMKFTNYLKELEKENNNK